MFDNLTVQQFCKNTVSLRVQGSAVLEPLRGNCKRQQKYSPYVDATPLPKDPKNHISVYYHTCTDVNIVMHLYTEVFKCIVRLQLLLHTVYGVIQT